MTQIRVLLPQLLAQRRVNRRQLAEAAGLRYGTLNDVYNGKHRPSLDTLESVISGLEKLTGEKVELAELLEVSRPVFGGPLKKFTGFVRPHAPKVEVPSEVLISEMRGER